MHDFKKLAVWSKSMDLTQRVYEITSGFPQEERYGLTSQMRRPSVSIASNIAEGAGRNSNKEFNNFLSIALGSAFELETQLLLSERLGLVIDVDLKHILLELESICKMIHSLKKKISEV